MKLTKNMISRIILVLIISSLFICTYAQGVNYVGTSAANFLKIGLGADYIGKAESDITTAENASVLYWNPGAISKIENVSFSVSYMNWLVGSNFAYLACSVPLGFVTTGLDISYFSSGDMEETTLAQQDGTRRFFSATDFVLGLAIAKNITDRFSVGIKFKYISESLSSVQADAFAFDVGSVFRTSFLNDMELGIALSNFGSSMQFSGNDLVVTQPVVGSPTNKVIPASLQTDNWSLPLFFRIGISTAAIKTEDFTFGLSASILDSRDYTTRYNVGGELDFFKTLSLRGGYRFNNNVSNFSAGVGVNIKSEYVGDMSFSYAYTIFKDLNSVHQVSVAFNL
jgi:hypothetical protein